MVYLIAWFDKDTSVEKSFFNALFVVKGHLISHLFMPIPDCSWQFNKLLFFCVATRFRD